MAGTFLDMFNELKRDQNAAFINVKDEYVECMSGAAAITDEQLKIAQGNIIRKKRIVQDQITELDNDYEEKIIRLARIDPTKAKIMVKTLNDVVTRYDFKNCVELLQDYFPLKYDFSKELLNHYSQLYGITLKSFRLYAKFLDDASTTMGNYLNSRDPTAPNTGNPFRILNANIQFRNTYDKRVKTLKDLQNIAYPHMQAVFSAEGGALNGTLEVSGENFPTFRSLTAVRLIF